MADNPDSPITYRLLTGEPDRAFCERVSDALDNGYVLYGQPILTHTGAKVVAAQAVVTAQALELADPVSAP